MRHLPQLLRMRNTNLSGINTGDLCDTLLLEYSIVSCYECGTRFYLELALGIYATPRYREIVSSCSECGMRFYLELALEIYATPGYQNIVSCSECGT